MSRSDRPSGSMSRHADSGDEDRCQVVEERSEAPLAGVEECRHLRQGRRSTAGDREGLGPPVEGEARKVG